MEKVLKRRFLFLILFTALVTAIIVWKYFDVMVLNYSPVEQTRVNASVERGSILDRNGNILAIQNRLDSIEVWIPSIQDRQRVARLLSEALNLDYDNLFESMESRTGSMWVKRKVSPTESKEVQSIISEEKLNGVYIRKEFGRNYPNQRLASHVIGYAGTDNIGLDGIEYELNEVLSPGVVGNDGEDGYGNQLYLTIDTNIEFFAEKYAKEAMEENKAKSVMIVVMDAKNGDILASASKPDFNPNTFYDYSASERKNRVFTMAYEPGSVMKIFSMSAFLELGGITKDTLFNCNGSYISSNFPTPITDLGVYGMLTPAGVIKHSSNVGAAYASETVNEDEFYQMLCFMGFGEKTGIPFPGESSGLLREPKNWSARSKPTISFGQEILSSAIQMATAATIFTNDGVLLRPHIIKKIVSPGGELIQENKREPVRRVLSAETARDMLLMMEKATEDDGTAHRLRIEGIRISAKTGTSQVIDSKTNKYSEQDFIASCIAIVPTDDPQLIIYTVIQNPKGSSIYGGRIATPIARKVIDDSVSYLGIKNMNNETYYHDRNITISQREEIVIGDTMPNFIGLPKRSILPLLKDDRFIIKISGNGWVVNQSPAQGTPIKDNMEIMLEFE